MAWYTSSNAFNSTPEWKNFITKFQTENPTAVSVSVALANFSLNPANQVNQPPKSMNQFFGHALNLVSQIKSYNNEVTDFIRKHIACLIRQSIRMILEIPHATESVDRKNRYPIQALDFIEGMVQLPNLFNINILNNQDFYRFYLKVLFAYFKQNCQVFNSQQASPTLQNSLYKNYFVRLFNVPYNFTDTEARMGANYSSTFSSMGNSLSIGGSINGSMSQRKPEMNFLECLVQFFQRNTDQNYLGLITQSVNTQSMVECLSKILIRTGRYNFPFEMKQVILRSFSSIKRNYLRLLTQQLNSNQSTRNSTGSQRQVLQFMLENILSLQLNIVNCGCNIYDGVKLFEIICSPENIKDVVELMSVNIVKSGRQQHGTQNFKLVPGFVEEHLAEFLLIVLHKDYSIYQQQQQQQLGATTQSKPQCKISMETINEQVMPLILSLKELVQGKGNGTKPTLKHINLIKILHTMVLNRLKYRSTIDILLKKHSMLTVLVQICQKHPEMDILTFWVMELFKSIFKGDINIAMNLNIHSPAQQPHLNYQELKKRNDLIEEFTLVQLFRACNLILVQVKAFKSHNEPMFGQFFKLAKIIKEYAKDYYSTIDMPIANDINHQLTDSCSSTTGMMSMSGSQVDRTMLEPVYQNEEVRSKCKEWYEFYKLNFQPIQNNYLRELGKFQEFDKMEQPKEIQYTQKRFCPEKVGSVTESQALSNKAEFQASVRASMDMMPRVNQVNSATDSITGFSRAMNLEKTDDSNQPQQIVFNFKKNKDELQSDSSSKIIFPSSTDEDSSKKSQIDLQDNIQDIISQPIKIEFKKKRQSFQQSSGLNQSESDSASQSDHKAEDDSQTSTFQDYMKKKMGEINHKNEQDLIKRRKTSKTPTRMKSSSKNDSKTPPKVKKWGSTVEPSPLTQTKLKQQNNSATADRQISPKASGITQTVQKNKVPKSQSQAPKKTSDIAQKSLDKLAQLKKRIETEKPLPIKLIKVGKKVPKQYKERVIDASNRDSRLMQWIRA